MQNSAFGQIQFTEKEREFGSFKLNGRGGCAALLASRGPDELPATNANGNAHSCQESKTFQCYGEAKQSLFPLMATASSALVCILILA